MINPYANKKSRSQRYDSIELEGTEATEEESMNTPCMSCPSTESASALVIAATDKAGMEGIDRESIDKIILRESGSSLYMQQQRKRDQQVDQNIEKIRDKLAKEEERSPNWRIKLQRIVDKELDEAISKRPSRSTCVVVDMDMFFMACELLTRPDLVDKPACVGGSMITTSNYVARRYGVRSAMAGWIGDKLVEELSGGKEKLVHVKSNFSLYKEKSMVVKKVLAEYDPSLSMYSLDEAFVDLAPYLALRVTRNWSHDQIRNELVKQSKATQTPNDARKIDQSWSENLRVLLSSYPSWLCRQHAADVITQMRASVSRETGGLTCSAGLAPNFLLAKIASDRNKPDGQCLVDSEHDRILEFLHPLPTRKVSGIGRVTEKTLQAFGVKTVEDLFTQRALVRFLFKPATAGFLARACVGCSDADHGLSSNEGIGNIHGQKGISRERTFASGESWTGIHSKLADVGRLLSNDMEAKNIWARTITVKVKLHTFDVYSRSRSMPHAVYLQHSEDLIGHAAELLCEIRKELNQSHFLVRLLGIRCSNFRGDDSGGAGQINIEQFLEPKHRSTGPATTPPYPFTSRPFFAPSNPGRSHVTNDDNPSALPPRVERNVRCPICHLTFSEDRNYELNQHIDSCLSGPVVRRVLREQNIEKSTPQRTERKRLMTEFL